MTITVQDAEIIEGGAETELDYYRSVQRAINGGTAWKFQGSYGRAMMDAIKSGLCMLGKTGASDAYGSYIPSRDEVKAGTFGSAQFVRDTMGDDWADAMEEA